MGRHALWLLMLCLIGMVGLAGCKGDNAPFRGETPFTGAWVGNFEVAGTNDSGIMRLTISDVATMQGTFTNFGTGETGIIRGATHADGLFNASFTLDGSGTVINISGIMAIEDSPSRFGLSGDGTWIRPGGGTRGVSFDLDQEGSFVNPFAGPYSGPWSASSSGDTGVMTLTIGDSGQMAGTYTNTRTGINGRVEGNVTKDGDFVGAMVETGTQVRIEIAGVMSEMLDGGLAGDGSYTRPGSPTEGFTFTFPAPGSGDGG